jgi:SAM-dependent methyltransferase
MLMSSTTPEYGLSGFGHKAIIDKYLGTLSDDATVLYLGCGSGQYGELLNLATRLVSPGTSRRKKLILADSDPDVRTSIETQWPGWPPGCYRILSQVLQLDASDMSDRLGDESVDLILTLGLFGDIRICGQQSTRITDSIVYEGIRRVFRECFRGLKPGGLLIIGNSSKRQPMEQFIKLSQQAGFTLIEDNEAQSVGVASGVDEPRYLLALRRVS